MKQVIGAIATPEIIDLVQANLCSRGDVNLVIRSSISEAFELYKLAGKADLIIVEDGPQKVNFPKIKESFKDQSVVVGIGETDSLSAPKNCIPTNELSSMGVIFQKVLGSEIALDSEYISMPSNLFVHFSSLSVDIFIKMTKDGKPHWVRRFLTGESITNEEVEKYKTKGVTEFWIEKDKIKEFSKNLMSSLLERSKSTLKSGLESVTEAQQVFSSMQEISQKMGIKGQMVSICESWMGGLAKSCMETEKSSVKDWWERLSKDPALDFQYKLVRLTALLCTQYVMMTDWNSKEEQAQKLAGAAMFADMELKDAKWIHLRSQEAVNALSGEMKIAVSSHAAYSAKKIQEIPFLTKDIANIVAQHHGHQTGEWIPERISANLSSLALVYIACEEMAYESLTKPEIDIKEHYKNAMLRHKATLVHKPLEQMKSIFAW
ncbi:MAG: hypothetical protein K2P81_10545 [Bacteriovoracaceae bacterium]|nr:hypothetical protein [Bacteriovoracaceae bacterium]